MLVTVGNWIYMTCITYLLGIGFRAFSRKQLAYEINKISHIIAIGFVIAGVYAQFFSIFFRVSGLANVLLVVSCVCILIWQRSEVVVVLQKWYAGQNKWTILWLLANCMIWAYFTSRGIIHYDSDLYHAQSIRWIEEYGVVPGLGNLHVRFAYNSSFFPLSALFSMKFLTGQSLHAVNGYFALLLSVNLYPLFQSWKNKKLRISDFARIGAFYYLSLICDEIVSPASDYATMCTIFLIVIIWLDCLEQERDEIAPYALLCVAGVFAVSLKLTTGILLLLVCKPAIQLIREKRVKQIFCYLGLGILVILPWIVRTVIISGYVLYPFPALDLFSFDWKIPKEMAIADAAEIKTWGRGIYDASKVGLPISAWFLHWFGELASTEKLLILADLVSVVVLGIHFLIAWCKKKVDWNVVLLMTAMLASYAFWQTSAPLIRYGYCYVILLFLLTLGICVQSMQKSRKWIVPICLLGMVFVLVYRTVPVAMHSVAVCRQPYWLMQKGYGTYEVSQYQIDGCTIYYPISGDRVGYEPFPASTAVKKIALRGEELKSGFKSLGM